MKSHSRSSCSGVHLHDDTDESDKVGLTVASHFADLRFVFKRSLDPCELRVAGNATFDLGIAMSHLGCALEHFERP